MTMKILYSVVCCAVLSSASNLLVFSVELAAFMFNQNNLHFCLHNLHLIIHLSFRIVDIKFRV